MLLIKNLLGKAAKNLINIENPAREAELILAKLLGKNRSYLLANSTAELSEDLVKKFFSLIARRAAGEPFAYLFQEQEFYSLNFKVSKDTLIPRAETELLVDLCLNKNNILENILPDYNLFNLNSINILEIGTGSGAIVISIAKEFGTANIIASDVSDKALEMAKYNGHLHQANNIEFIKSDLYANIPVKYINKFDFIISNPPYIDINSVEVEPHVKQYEPHNALFAAEEGLYFLRKIILDGKKWLNSKGIMLLEHGFDQAVAVSEIAKSAGYNSINLMRDYAGKDRVTILQK